MTLSIPERLDDLTPEWLTAALRQTGELAPAGEVTSVEREIVGEGEGFLGDIARLTLGYEGGEGPATVIAKLPKLANRAMGELLGAYERESCFYDELARDLPLATPRMYYGDFDRDVASERQEAALKLADRTPRFLAGRMTQFGKWVSGRKKRRYILLLEDIGTRNRATSSRASRRNGARPCWRRPRGCTPSFGAARRSRTASG